MRLYRIEIARVGEHVHDRCAGCVRFIGAIEAVRSFPARFGKTLRGAARSRHVREEDLVIFFVFERSTFERAS